MIGKLSQSQKKVLYWILICLGIITFLFMIIFNASYWTTHERTQENYGMSTKVEADLAIALSVMIPFLCGVICFVSSEYFNIMTKREVENQCDQLLDNGWINLEQWTVWRDTINNNYSKKVETKEKQKLARMEQEQKILLKQEQQRKQMIENFKKVAVNKNEKKQEE